MIWVRIMGTTFRENSIAKEMKYVRPTIRKLDNGEIMIIGYQCVNCHTIFDVKTGDFHRTYVLRLDFVAMKVVMETLQEKIYKLRIMGIPISGTSYIYSHNISVIQKNYLP